jgi:hypothetical protein
MKPVVINEKTIWQEQWHATAPARKFLVVNISESPDGQERWDDHQMYHEGV